MKTETGKTKTLFVALLLGVSLLPAYAEYRPGSKQETSEETSEAAVRFKALDTDKNGFLSLEEFKAKGMDDLTFKASDTNGDGSVEPDEYASYLKARAADQSKAGTADQPRPADAPLSKPADAPPKY
jgi:hypothetical protein